MKEYEAPSTKKTQVELEGSLCASVDIRNPDADNGRIDEHKTNSDFNADFSESAWDTDPTKQ